MAKKLEICKIVQVRPGKQVRVGIINSKMIDRYFTLSFICWLICSLWGTCFYYLFPGCFVTHCIRYNQVIHTRHQVP